MQLKAIGFWKDVCNPPDDPFHNPHEFVTPESDPEQRRALADYLRRGAVHRTYFGLSSCRFACGASPESLGCSDLTDGTWVWPEALGHYVSAHAVRLPEDFVAHALGAARGPLRRGAYCESIDYDFASWLDWCHDHTSGLPDAVNAHRPTPDARRALDRALEERLEALAQKYGGEGERACGWAGCDRPALVKLAFCARCAHTHMNLWP